MIYMDNIAGTKPDQEVIDSMLPWLTTKYGNPGAHFYPLGRESYAAVESARKEVAALLGSSDPETVVFTSSGTESNNLALKGYLLGAGNSGKRHVITTEIEHFSVRNSLIKMINQGFEITFLKVNKEGLVDPDELKRSLRSDTALVSIGYANPEIGSVQRMVELGSICKNHGVIFHSDAVAAAGLLPIDVDLMNVDLLSIAGQNFYGPRGSGALYVRKGTILKPLFDGGSQEYGLRAGSENVAGIVGLGTASKIALRDMQTYVPFMSELGDKLMNGFESLYDILHITGGKTNRLPGNVSFWVEHIEGESLLMWYALNKIYAASGSACSSNILAEDEEDLAGSHVLSSVGVPTDICAGSMTFSMSKYTTKDEVSKVLEVTPTIVDKLLMMSPTYNRK